MNDLTPSYEPDAGQVILEGRPAGPGGEAGLVPVAGVDLAFDRGDGHLVRVVADAGDQVVAGPSGQAVAGAGGHAVAGAGGHAVAGAGGQAAAALLLNRLFGLETARILDEVAASPAEPGAPQPYKLSPEPVLCAALSSLARLYAARDTSPVPRRSPWWAAEAAVLAEQAGLPDRVRAEVGRLGGTIMPQRTCTPGFDVAAEVEELEKDSGLPGLSWVLDPALVPAGFIRPGLSPHSDLAVRHDSGGNRVTVAATLAPGADGAGAARCQVRLVDPVVRRVLAKADFRLTESRICAELRLPVPLDELDGAWIEVVEEPHRPVRSTQAHLIQRALRWADTALRAERAPAGLAPQAAAGDWAALAALAWQRCRQDWAAAGDSDRATAHPAPGAQVPDGQAPATQAPATQAPGPACLAEILGY